MSVDTPAEKTIGKFTPGPWTCRSKDGKKWASPGMWRADYDGPATIASHAAIRADKKVVALVVDTGPSDVCLDANAYLVAAAPELMEACRKAMTCASIPDYVRDLLMTAIAKAEGGAA